MSFALYELKAGETVGIYGAVYTVGGMAEFRQGTYLWKEYMLEGASGQCFWLSVERDERVSVCGLYREMDAAFPAEARLIHEGKAYTLAETGRAEVLDCFGLSGVAAGDAVGFWEYRSGTGLLSREQWGEAVECASGTEIPKADITLDGDAPANTTEPAAGGFAGLSWEKMRVLPIGQELEIEREKYCVMGCVYIEQGDFHWVEYDIQADARSRAWLSAEPSPGGGCVLSLHRSIPYRKLRYQEGYSRVLWQGEVYERVEEGHGGVTGFRGRGDYDDGELFQYSEYRSPSGKILTRETWVSDMEHEASTGQVLNSADVKILGVRNLSARELSVIPNPEKEWANIPNLPPDRWYELKWVKAFFNMLLICFMFACFFAVELGPSEFINIFINTTPRIERQLASHSSFKRVSTVSMAGGEKAAVYATPLSADAACSALIDMDPERVEYVTTTSEPLGAGEEAERMLRTSRESVMVYQSEEGVTHVQVSPNEKESRPYSAYHARSPLRLGRLYSASRSWEALNRPPDGGRAYNIDTGRYVSEVASARQESVTARRSGGGGTGFGK